MTTQDIKLWYKQSPLWLIPEDWECKELEKICNIAKWEQLNTVNLTETWEYPSYSWWVVPSWFTTKWNTEKNTIIISEWWNSCWYVNYIKTRFWSWWHCYTVQDIKIEKLFLYQQLKFSQNKIMRLRIGSWLPNIQKQDLLKFNLCYPLDFQEQETIAKILWKVDETIEKTQNMIEKLELRNKWLEQKLLKNDNRNEIKLQNLFERVTDKNSEWNTNVVTISAQKWFIKQNDFFNKFVASETLDNYYLVKKWEFCYNKSYSNWYPMWAIKRLNDFDKAVVTTLYICFRIKDLNKTSWDFFEYYFNAWLLNKWLIQIAYEWWRAHWLLNVSPNDFFNLKIRVPEIEEQKAIANILNKANKQLNKYEQKLEKLQELKKWLMQQLLTWKVRVKEFRN